MKVAPLITVALILCITFPGLIQAKKKPKPKKICVGKDGNRYEEGEGYVDREGKACIHYKCAKKKGKLIMKTKECVEDGEWSSWSSWSDCSATCGRATKKRTRTCSNPEPSNGGKPCNGTEKENKKCSNPPCGPVLIHTDTDYNYYKIPVPASLQMLSTVIVTTCSNFDMWPQCMNADYVDNNCIEAPSTSINWQHPSAMSKILCGTTSPHHCASTLNMFWYMDDWLSGSACGATKAGGTCSTGKDYTSTIDMPYFAACLKPVTPDTHLQEEEMILVKNKLIATLPTLGKEYTISLEFTATSFTSDFRNVIHFATDSIASSTNSNPGFWIRSHEKKMYMNSIIDGKSNWHYVDHIVPINTWINVEINQKLKNGKYMFTVLVDGKQIYEKENTKPKEYENVKVYASNPTQEALNGSIRKFFLQQP